MGLYLENLSGAAASQLRSLHSLKTQIGVTQRMLTTGRRDHSFDGETQLAHPSIPLRAALSGARSWLNSLDRTQTQIKIRATHLEHIRTTVSDALSRFRTLPFAGREGKSRVAMAMDIARTSLADLVSTMSADVAGHHLFSGSDIGKSPVGDIGSLLNGVSGKAGLREIGRERYKADRGVFDKAWREFDRTQVGELNMKQTTNTGVFGFSILDITSSLAGFTVDHLGGVDDNLRIRLDGGVPQSVPENGQKLAIDVSGPAGVKSTIVVEAVSSGQNLSPGQFYSNPADVNGTLDNLADAVEAAVQSYVKRDLKAASYIAGAEGYLDHGETGEAVRVEFDAGGLPIGLRSDPLLESAEWYLSMPASANARASAYSKVGGQRQIQYGIQANELPFRELAAVLASFDAIDVTASSLEQEKTVDALIAAAIDRMDRAGGIEDDIKSIESEMAMSLQSSGRLKTFFTSLADISITALGEIQTPNQDRVAVLHSTLANRLQLSYQAASAINKITFADYL